MANLKLGKLSDRTPVKITVTVGADLGQGRQPGTDYSVFQGLQTLGEILVMAAATALTARAGYAVTLSTGLVIAPASMVMGLAR